MHDDGSDRGEHGQDHARGSASRAGVSGSDEEEREKPVNTTENKWQEKRNVLEKEAIF